MVLLVSFVALAVLWPKPRLERCGGARCPGRLGGHSAPAGGDRLRRDRRGPARAGRGGRLVGSESALNNFAPTFVLITFWVGVAFASALFGDMFTSVQPWRALGRASGWLVTPSVAGEGPGTAPIPSASGAGRRPWGCWPSPGSSWCPGGARSRGRWRRRLRLQRADLAGDGGVRRGDLEPTAARRSRCTSTCSRASRPSRRATGGGRAPAAWRPAAARRPVPARSRSSLVMIGTVTFDGLSQGSVWADLSTPLDDELIAAGMTLSDARKITGTLGLLACVALVGGFYALGIAGARSVGGSALGRAAASLRSFTRSSRSRSSTWSRTTSRS